jgi:Fur family ferric uptake transcriptional regulator
MSYDIESIKNILTDYLVEHKLRKTPERFALLEAVYDREDHFDAETLYLEMKKKNYKVSRATVYNTLEVLLNCNLIVKHQFGKKLALFEKSFGYRQHDHLICNTCDKIMEFCDPRIMKTQIMLEELFQFKINTHNLHFYGTCTNPHCDGKKSQTTA